MQYSIPGDNLCQIIRDYFQLFSKGYQINRRAEFLEEWYVNLTHTIIIIDHKYKLKLP